MAQTERPDIDEAEREALHELQLGIEHVHRAYGHLLAFHHQIGRGMDRFAAAEPLLRETGHEELADSIRDDVLPAGVIDDRWSYELVEAFERGFLSGTVAFERSVREEVAGGVAHVAEREQQREWRERARR
ncbi:hypothetical protein N0B31_16190 [Salinirubellus salinus]|jgi:hypothetical protein|uniref:Uncharacterized protein n=1 Tax=Salinirubellus salinus TaxID=1364945 RepID=A0A9E7R1T1_9EURY|nr:hypothetical protein [Salinirubellus salinus]UWM53664.1 hypothetical protein N0B31_16190 [Salinirubellus salinus]